MNGNRCIVLVSWCWFLGKNQTFLGLCNSRVTDVLIQCPRVSVWTRKEILMTQFLSKTRGVTHIIDCCRQYRDGAGWTQLMCCCWWLDGWLFFFFCQHLLSLDSDVWCIAGEEVILGEDVTNCHSCWFCFVCLALLLTFWASFQNQIAAILVFGCQKSEVLAMGSSIF